jgi:hypothetical protein
VDGKAAAGPVLVHGVASWFLHSIPGAMLVNRASEGMMESIDRLVFHSSHVPYITCKAAIHGMGSWSWWDDECGKWPSTASCSGLVFVTGTIACNLFILVLLENIFHK